MGGWRRGAALAASLSRYLPRLLFPCSPSILVQAVLLLLQFGAVQFPLSESFQLLLISSCIVRTVIEGRRGGKRRSQARRASGPSSRPLLRARLPLSQALAGKCWEGLRRAPRKAGPRLEGVGGRRAPGGGAAAGLGWETGRGWWWPGPPGARYPTGEVSGRR